MCTGGVPHKYMYGGYRIDVLRDAGFYVQLQPCELRNQFESMQGTLAVWRERDRLPETVRYGI